LEAARPATRGDLDRLVDLAEQAADELAAGRGGKLWRRREARPPPVRASLEASVAASEAGDDQLVVVGTIDEVAVGFAAVHRETLRDGDHLGVIDDLYVEPGARQVGVGEAMMQRLLDWCEARGCIGVDSLALPGERHTKNFFESFGLVARAIVVHRSLDRGTDET
jgi:GNAT superfamily N-acetyltransferase